MATRFLLPLLSLAFFLSPDWQLVAECIKSTQDLLLSRPVPPPASFGVELLGTFRKQSQGPPFCGFQILPTSNSCASVTVISGKLGRPSSNISVQKVSLVWELTAQLSAVLSP